MKALLRNYGYQHNIGAACRSRNTMVGLSHVPHPCARDAAAAAAPPANVSTAQRSRSRIVAAAGPTDVFVLDFDGVLVDSEPEVSMSAYTAARDYWPAVFQGATAGQQAQVLQGLRTCRPVLVRGYESMVMARMLLEDPNNSSKILGDWEAVLPDTLKTWGEDWQALQQAFEEHRAGWLDRDRQGWLACNRPYKGIVDALASCEAPFYIASSKAAHRVAVLARDGLGLDLDADSPRLFCSLIPPNEKKVAALREIATRPVAQGARLHFVDDRLETLRAAEEAGLLQEGWSLYLAEWGYCTPEEKEEAKRMPGIKMLGLEGFIELLKWGIVMGVTDGCEPTPEEVADGVRSAHAARG